MFPISKQSQTILPITKTEVKYNQNRDVKINSLLPKQRCYAELLALPYCTKICRILIVIFALKYYVKIRKYWTI